MHKTGPSINSTSTARRISLGAHHEDDGDIDDEAIARIEKRSRTMKSTVEQGNESKDNVPSPNMNEQDDETPDAINPMRYHASGNSSIDAEKSKEGDDDIANLFSQIGSGKNKNKKKKTKNKVIPFSGSNDDGQKVKQSFESKSRCESIPVDIRADGEIMRYQHCF